MLRTWDLRQPKQALQGLTGHAGDVLRVDWARADPNLLASSSADKHVLVWDYRRAGRAVDAETDRFHLQNVGKPGAFLLAPHFQ